MPSGEGSGDIVSTSHHLSEIAFCLAKDSLLGMMGRREMCRGTPWLGWVLLDLVGLADMDILWPMAADNDLSNLRSNTF